MLPKWLCWSTCLSVCLFLCLPICFSVIVINPCLLSSTKWVTERLTETISLNHTHAQNHWAAQRLLRQGNSHTIPLQLQGPPCPSAKSYSLTEKTDHTDSAQTHHGNMSTDQTAPPCPLRTNRKHLPPFHLLNISAALKDMMIQWLLGLNSLSASCGIQ